MTREISDIVEQSTTSQEASFIRSVASVPISFISGVLMALDPIGTLYTVARSSDDDDIFEHPTYGGFGYKLEHDISTHNQKYGYAKLAKKQKVAQFAGTVTGFAMYTTGIMPFVFAQIGIGALNLGAGIYRKFKSSRNSSLNQLEESTKTSRMLPPGDHNYMNSQQVEHSLLHYKKE